ncbi:MAG: tetratricopeptide repeat protein [Meiothermus sp.]|nr:tetratricopeptide repeat protein [Meiothermus sp.]
MSALGKDREVGLEGGAAGPSARLRAVTLRRAGLAMALWGEPGVGKTHLAARLLREAGCRSFSFHSTVPLGTLLATLPRPAGRVALPAWAEGPLERLAAGGSVPPEQAADALVALLAALAPMVLLFEDLHEAGVVRGELIQSLARRVVRTRGVGLLATTRSEPPEVFEGYRLERLSPEGTRSMLEREIGGALPDQAHRWVHRHAAGNPLFSLEYLRLLARQGFLWSDGRRWNWREPSGRVVPVTVEALLESMIGEATADEKVRSALEARAILPIEADTRLWAAVSGLDEAALVQSKARLEALGLLRGGDFAHPLFREHSAALTPPGRRKALARRALEALRQTNLQVAAAFAAQADLPPDETFGLLSEAALEAEESGDPVQAARWKLEAVAVAPLELRAALALEAAEGYRPHSLEQAAEAARAALGAEPDNVEALFLLAELLALRGFQSEADAALKRLPARLRESPAWPMRQLMVRSALEDHAGVVRLWDEHPELHRTAPPLNVVATIDAMLYLGRFDEAVALAEQTTVRAGLEPLEQALLERALGRAEFYAGRLEASRARFEAVLPVIARHSPGHQTALTLVRLGICHYYAGNFTEALKSLQEGLAEFARLGDGRWCAVAKHYLGSVYAGLGQPDRWEELFLGAYEYLSRLGPSDSLVNVGNALAWAYSHGGTPLNRLLGLKYARNATATARDLGSVRAVLNSGVQLSLALSYTGDARQGLSVAEESLHQLRGLDYPFISALTLEAKGVALAALGQPEPALAA